ncbi:hypothetical protein ZIOFF_058664 [Zingiber officinale]|uniref:Uncharacterized protein n=1 Tax=Zingiber officinale TaxID=94328 RepID=A0A8J5F404_ZINOF|nr:hypothetical protein ZIOFF_058664 [Zingiber officinale]
MCNGARGPLAGGVVGSGGGVVDGGEGGKMEVAEETIDPLAGVVEDRGEVDGAKRRTAFVFILLRAWLVNAVVCFLLQDSLQKKREDDSGRFLLLKRNDSELTCSVNGDEASPSLKIQLDKEIYRPGDTFIATVEISTPQISNKHPDGQHWTNQISSFLLDNFSYEIKGVEKLDSQWFATQKPLPGIKQRRGERLFIDCTAPSIVSKVMIPSGCSKTYMVRIELPQILPPSYRGVSIRYIYYVRVAISGRWLGFENNDHSVGLTYDSMQVSWIASPLIKATYPQLIHLVEALMLLLLLEEQYIWAYLTSDTEAKAPLQMVISQKNNNCLTQEGELPNAADQLDIFWKEKDADAEWIRVNENIDVVEEGYDSSKDEVSSISSYNPNRGNTDLPYRTLSLQSTASRLSNNDFHQLQSERTVPSYVPLTQLSVAEVMDDSGEGVILPQDKPNDALYTPSSSMQRSYQDFEFHKNDTTLPHTPKPVEPSLSEGFVHGRSYNIRIDDRILLRFSPKNTNSTYYFGDMIGGTLTFFHGGIRSCLEVAITLEIAETINQRFVHPSRRSSPTIIKILSEHQEVVADLVQTSFLFSIPIDGPMSFSTPKVSVQWSLRFEFFTTPKDLDLTRYEHPLLVEEREKGEWVMPITVHAPPLRIQTAREKNLSLGNLFHS